MSLLVKTHKLFPLKLTPKLQTSKLQNPKLQNPKLCKDCKFLNKNKDCTFQKFIYTDEYMDDTFEYYLSATACRKNEMICGINAKNFENFDIFK